MFPDTHSLVIKGRPDLPPPEEYVFRHEKPSAPDLPEVSQYPVFDEWREPGIDYGSYTHRQHSREEVDDLIRSTDRLMVKYKLREQMEHGILPDLPGKYSLAWDDHEDEIPSLEFAALFADYKIPIARKGLKLHNHDMNHVLSYQELLAVDEFSGTVHDAAVNAEGDSEKSKIFTDCIDVFGDAHELVQSGVSRIFVPHAPANADRALVSYAREKLIALVELASPDSDSDQRAETVSEIWVKLGFAELEINVLMRAARELTRIAGLEAYTEVGEERHRPITIPSTTIQGNGGRNTTRITTTVTQTRSIPTTTKPPRITPTTTTVPSSVFSTTQPIASRFSLDRILSDDKEA